jgi:hypothetical protein
LTTAYLAARFGRRAEMQEKRRDLESIGVSVTSRWLEEPDENHNMDFTSAEAAELARGDWVDIDEAETLILFTEAPPFPTTLSSRGGRFVEFGYALASGKRVIVVGPVENLFTGQVERYDDWDDCLKGLMQ